MSAKSVLVTGSTGYIGSYAVQALEARGFEVHALGRKRPTHPSAKFHSIDLLDAKAVRKTVVTLGASHLLHLAWCTEPEHFWRSASNLDWAASSLTLVRAFREAGGQRIVATGSCAEYAWGPPRLHESSPCIPATLYGAAKDSTRRVLEAYAAETGLSLAWGRLFYIYGPGGKAGRLVHDAVRALRSGERFATSQGMQRRDFSHVFDIANALAALIDVDVTGPINIASGQGIRVCDIVACIGQLTGRSDLIDYGAQKTTDVEPSSIVAEISRLRDEVGFNPKFDIEEGLTNTLTMSPPPT